MATETVDKKPRPRKVPGFKPWYKIDPTDFILMTRNIGVGRGMMLTHVFFEILHQQRPIRMDVESIAAHLSIKPSLAKEYIQGLLKIQKLKLYKGHLYNEWAIELINEMIEHNGGEPFVFPPVNEETEERFNELVKAGEKMIPGEDLAAENEVFLHAADGQKTVPSVGNSLQLATTRTSPHKKSNDINRNFRKNQNQNQNNPLTPQGGLSGDGEKPSKSRSSKNRKLTDEELVEFQRIRKLFHDQFLPAYPKKEEVGFAFTAFSRALESATLEEIMAGVARYVLHVAGWDPRYVKTPTKWLNSHGWLDVYTTEKVGEAAEFRRKGPIRWDDELGEIYE